MGTTSSLLLCNDQLTIRHSLQLHSKLNAIQAIIMCSSDIFLGVLAILFPPLPVWVKRGICSADSVINILLCVLGFIPGLLHAWYIIAKFPDEYDYEYESLPDRERQPRRVVYVVQGQPQTQPRPSGGRPQGYGTQQQDAGVGGSNQDPNVPPSYADVVAGDNKIQSRE